MNEEEAETKWCPFAESRSVKVTHKDQAAYVMFSEESQPPTCNCISSDCMAWRWSDTRNEVEGKANAWRGYCGLAGRP